MVGEDIGLRSVMVHVVLSGNVADETAVALWWQGISYFLYPRHRETGEESKRS